MLKRFWPPLNLPVSTMSIQQMAIDVLQAATAPAKVDAAHKLATYWHQAGDDTVNYDDLTIDLSPGRPPTPELVAPKDVKRRRLGSLQGRTALLHAIAHIEFNAIDLAADMLARFGGDKRISDGERKAFITDWVQVCDDEARHFTMIQNRLSDLNSFYGALPAHDGLWEAAMATSHDLAARLVVAPMVLEARGLDVTPGMIEKLTSVGDIESAAILKVIYTEEIAHVAAGTRWFYHICHTENHDPDTYFKSLVNAHYKGVLKPPFNTKAREMAGMSASLYQL